MLPVLLAIEVPYQKWVGGNSCCHSGFLSAASPLGMHVLNLFLDQPVHGKEASATLLGQENAVNSC